MLIGLLLAGCGPKSPEVLAGPDTALTVRLVNPTSCSFCDPFAGVDTLRVDVLAGEQVVATDTFGYPGEEVALPDLADFGVVRIQLVGLSGGRVVSVGRTREVALDEGTPLDVPMLFLPANVTVPLGAEMTADRSRHLAVRRRDGRVLLFGGVNPDRDGTFSSIEMFDPDTFAFGLYGASLPAGVAAPRAAWTGLDEVLLVGGFNTSGTGEVASNATAAWSQAGDTVRSTAPLFAPRNGHCFVMYRDRLGLVLGGNPDTNAGELVKLSDTTEDWEFANVPMRDFDQTEVSACIALPDGGVFVQGDDATTTGAWRFDEGDTDAGESFTPIVALGEGADRYVHAPMLVVEGQQVWIAGGADPFGGGALDDGRWYDPTRNGFTPALGLAQPRVEPAWDRWIAGTWLVAGCGWKDDVHLRGEPSVEFVDPAGEHVGPSVAFDRDRTGCTVTTLLDGSVLVTGGYDASDGDVVDAAVVVPWLGD